MPDLIPLDHLTELDSFGHAVRGLAYRFRPARADEIAALFQRAQRAGLSVALRGSGRSYGDAALNAGQVVLDLRRMNRILDWNPDSGLIRVEPGVTFQQLWQFTLEDGWWPPVVPGTMFPTLGGALAMNIHGKNNWQAGTLGEHVRAFTALLPTGENVVCAPDQNPDLFYSLIGGAGLLGVFTSITLQLKRLYSGDVRVHAWATPDLRTMLNDLDWFKADHDYIVGWVDGAHPAGRGQIHAADYLAAGEDAHPARSLTLDYQTLPDSFFGVLPKASLWFFMQFLMNNPGVAVTNFAKYLLSATLENRQQYRQSLAAFNFLLDYVPNWERAYGAGGLIQYQTFLPLATAADAYREMLRQAQRRGRPAYLGVTKRHRPDNFLLTHAVDGYSLALDFKVPAGRGAAL
ncbi:MAG: FAD-binding oxidoreductase, partial [Anaerolineales bacterium]|nr:FAD-binding oxidoreductase [Anaerolineales bacterium]